MTVDEFGYVNIELLWYKSSNTILHKIQGYNNINKIVKEKGLHPRAPKYKDKNKGRNIVIYTNQCFKLNILITILCNFKFSIHTQ